MNSKSLERGLKNLKAKRQKLEILGTIKRQCQDCGKHKDCTNFEKDGEIHYLCSECMTKVYMENKDTPEVNLKYCKNCGGKSMKQIPEKTEITETHIIKHYECERCANKDTHKIKKWRR